MHTKEQENKTGMQSPHRSWVARLDKLARILLSVILVANLVPVVPVTSVYAEDPAEGTSETPQPSNEGEDNETNNTTNTEDPKPADGKSDSKSDTKDSGTEETKGSEDTKGEGASGQKSGQEGNQNDGGEPEKSGPTITAQITGFVNGNATTPYLATLGLVADYSGENTKEDNVALTVTVPEGSVVYEQEGTDLTAKVIEDGKIILKKGEGTNVKTVSISLPQDDYDAITYTNKSFVVAVEGKDGFNPSYAEGVTEKVVPTKYSVSGSVVYSGEQVSGVYVGDVTATVTLTAEFDNTAAASDSFDVTVVGAEGTTMNPTNGKVTLKNTKGNKFDTVTVTMPAGENVIKSYSPVAATYGTNKEATIDGAKTITINTTPYANNATIEYNVGGSGDIVINQDVVATVTIGGAWLDKADDVSVSSAAGGSIAQIEKQADQQKYTVTYSCNSNEELVVADNDITVTAKNRVGETIVPSGARKVCIDKVAPEINVTMAVPNTSKELSSTSAEGRKEQWFDLVGDDELTVTVKASDTNLNVEGTTASISVNDETKDTKKADGSGNIQFTYGASSLMDTDGTAYAFNARTLTFIARDTAGNETTLSKDNFSEYVFGSDSYAFEQFPYALSTSAADNNTLSGVRDGKPVFSKRATLDFACDKAVPDGIFAYNNSSVIWSPIDSSQTIQWNEGKASVTIEGEDGKNQSYTAQATLVTNHGATREFEEYKFDIDASEPEIKVTVDQQSNAIVEGNKTTLFYGNGKKPNVTITVERASTLKEITNDEKSGLVVYLVNEETNEETILTSVGEGSQITFAKTTKTYEEGTEAEKVNTQYTFTLDPDTIDWPAKSRIKVVGNTIFGTVKHPVGESEKSDVIIVDQAKPKIAVSLGSHKDISDFRTLFSIPSITGDAEVLITVEDANLDENKLTVKVNDVPKEVLWTLSGNKATAKVNKYAMQEPAISLLTESRGEEQNGFNLYVEATDKASNTATYSYKDAVEEVNPKKLAVDVESPRLTSVEVLDSDGNTIDASYTTDVPWYGISKVGVYDADALQVRVTAQDLNFDTANSKVYVDSWNNGVVGTSSSTNEWVLVEGSTNKYQLTAPLSLDKTEEAKGNQIAYGIRVDLYDLTVTLDNDGNLESGNPNTTEDTWKSGKKIGHLIALDNVKPNIIYAFDNNVSNTVESTKTDYYKTKKLTGIVTVVDPWIDANTLIVTKGTTKADGFIDEETIQLTKGAAPGRFEGTVEFEESVQDQFYTLGVTAEDCLAHNEDNFTYKDYRNEEATQFVVDGTAPTVKVALGVPSSSKALSQTTEDGRREQWFDLVGENDELTVMVKAEDTRLEKDETTVTVTGGKQPVVDSKKSEKQFTFTYSAVELMDTVDSDTGTAHEFNGHSLTFVAKDTAGNETTVSTDDISEYVFGSDSYAFTQYPFELRAEPGDNSLGGLRDGIPVYSKDVKFTLGSVEGDEVPPEGIFAYDKSTVAWKTEKSSAILQCSGGDGKASATIEGADGMNEAYAAEATLTTANGAQRVFKNCTFTINESKVLDPAACKFDIDASEPEIKVTVGNQSNTIVEGNKTSLFYGSGDKPSVTITVERASTLKNITNDKKSGLVIYLVNEESEEKTILTSVDDESQFTYTKIDKTYEEGTEAQKVNTQYTFTLDPSRVEWPAKSHIEVVGNTIFNTVKTPANESDKSKHIIIDDAIPVLTSVEVLDSDGKAIAAKYTSDEKWYDISNVNVYNTKALQVRVTAQDPNFDTANSKVYVDSWCNGTAGDSTQSTEWTLVKGSSDTYQLTAPLSLDETEEAKGNQVAYGIRVELCDHTANPNNKTNVNTWEDETLGYLIAMDNADPKIEYSFDSNVNTTVGDIDYYKTKKLTATVTVVDAWINADAITVKKSGTEYQAQFKERTSGTPGDIEAKIEFEESALNEPYTLDVSVKDYLQKDKNQSYAEYRDEAATQFVVDGTAPTVKVDFEVPSKSVKILPTIDTDSKTKTQWFDLVEEDAALTVTVTAEDTTLVKDKTSVTITPTVADGKEPVVTDANGKKQFKYTYTAADLMDTVPSDDGTNKYEFNLHNLTFVAKDTVGNETTISTEEIGMYAFGCDSCAFTKYPFGLSVAPGKDNDENDTFGALRNGVPVYSDAVELTFECVGDDKSFDGVFDYAKSSVVYKMTDASEDTGVTAFTWANDKASATIKGEAGKNASYSVEATLITANGAQRSSVGKIERGASDFGDCTFGLHKQDEEPTVYTSGKYDFDIDTTEPEALVTVTNINESSKLQEEDEEILYYGKGIKPTVEVSFTRASTLLENAKDPLNPAVVVTLVDEKDGEKSRTLKNSGDDREIEWTANYTDKNNVKYTGVIISDKISWTSTYHFEAKGETVFGTQTVGAKNVDESGGGQGVIVDHNEPDISVNLKSYKDPVSRQDTDDFYRILFAATDVTGDNNVVITVTDENIDKEDIVVKVNEVTKTVQWTRSGNTLTGTISKYAVDDPAISLAKKEQNGFDLSVVATDKAKNSSTYSYKNSVGKNDPKKLSVDVESPRLVSVEVLDGEGNAIEKKYTPEAKWYYISNVNVYDTKSLQVRVTAQDLNFDTMNSKVYVDSWNNGTAGDSTQSTEWTLVKGSSDTYQLTAPLSLDEAEAAEGNQVVYGVRVDLYDLTVTLNKSGKLESGNPNTTEDTWKSGKKLGYLIAMDDNTKPTITYTFDPVVSNTVEGTDYYAAKKVTATITVVDPWLDNSTISVTKGINKPNGETETETTYPTGASLVPGKAEVTVEFEESALDESYTLNVTAGDHLDHKQEDYSYEDFTSARDKKATKFVVDGEIPSVKTVINQHYAGMIKQNDGSYVDYYDTKGSDGLTTATITVTDRNFDSKNSQIPNIANVDRIEQWEQQESHDTWVAHVYFTETPVDLTYNLGEIKIVDYTKKENVYHYGDQSDKGAVQSTVSAYDGKSVEVSGEGFVVDVTQPTIEVRFGTAKGETNVKPVGKVGDEVGGKDAEVDYYDRKNVIVTVTVTDNNFDAAKTTVDFGDMSQEVRDVPDGGEWEQDGNTWTRCYSITELGSKEDYGKYNTLEVRTQDLVQTAADDCKRDLVTTHSADWDYGGGDRNGKGASGAEYFALDSIAPTIDVRFYGSPVQTDGKTGTAYFGEEVRAEVTVTDAHLDLGSRANMVAREAELGKETGDTGIAWKDNRDGTHTGTARFSQTDAGKFADILTKDLGVRDMLHKAAPEGGEPDGGTHNTTYDFSSNGDNTTTRYGTGEPAEGVTRFFVDLDTPRVSVEMDQHYAGRLKQGDGSYVDYYDTLTESGGKKKLRATITVIDSAFHPEVSTIEGVQGGVVHEWKDADGTTRIWDQKDPEERPYEWVAYVDFGETPVDETYNLGTVKAVDWVVRDNVYHYGDQSDKGAVQSTVATYDGKSVEVSGEGFVVDVTQPTIEVRFGTDKGKADIEPVGDLGGVDYYDEAALVATVTVTDNNFDAGNTSVSFKAGDDTVTQKLKDLSGKWEQDGNTWTRHYRVSEEAAKDYGRLNGLDVETQDLVKTAADEGGIALETAHDAKWGYDKDKRNGKSPSGADSFVLDHTAPAIEVSFGTDKGKSDLEPVGKLDSVDYYDASSLVATVTVTENNFDAANTTVGFGAKAQALEDLSGEWEQDGNTWTRHYRVTENAENDYGRHNGLDVETPDLVKTVAGGVALKGAHDATWAYRSGDRNGHAPSRAGSFVLDHTAPTIEVVFNRDPVSTDGDTGTAYFDDDVIATITVTDAHLDAATLRRVRADGVDEWEDWVSGDDGTYKATATFKQTKAGHFADILTTDSGNVGVCDRLYSSAPADNKPSVRSHNTTYDFSSNGNHRTTKYHSGKKPKKGVKQFFVDKDTPQVSVEIDQNYVGTLDDVDYYDTMSERGNQKYLRATITVKDSAFRLDKSKIEGVKHGSVTKWEQRKANTWVATIDFLETPVNVTYDLGTITATDWVGRKNEYQYGDQSTEEPKQSTKAKHGDKKVKVTGNSFVVDITKPKVSITMNKTPLVTYKDTDYYPGVSDDKHEDTLEATIEVIDDHFDSNKDISTIKALGSYVKNKNEINWHRDYRKSNKWTATVVYTENKSNDLPGDNFPDASGLKVYVQDKVQTAAGDEELDNHRTENNYGTNTSPRPDGITGHQFVLDCTSPEVTKVNDITQHSGIYNPGQDTTDQGALLFYKEAGSGITIQESDFNGLDKVEISVRDNSEGSNPFRLKETGEDKQKGIQSTKHENTIYLIEGNGTSEDARQELIRKIEVTLTDIVGNYSVWNISPSGRATLISTHSADITTTPVSVSGQGDMHPERMVLDTTAPRLEWSTSVQEGAYYNTTQQVTLNVTERNFNYLQKYDASQTVITENAYAGNAGRALTQSTRSVSDFSGGEDSFSHTLTFENDGHYVLNAKLTDPANNTTEAAEFKEFTIDKTAPKIVSITYDNNDVRNGKYYKAVRTATITVEEHNWDEAAQGSFITSNGTIGGWSHNGDTHVATVYFGTDGDYNLSVSITDKAGNNASQKEDEFTVDLTAPTITFENVENEHAYGRKASITPAIVFADEKNFDSSGIEWELTGAKNGKQDYASSTTPNGSGAVVTYANFDPTKVEYDDIYTLKAHMVDLAGNEADGEILFSVNRYGSNFMVRNEKQYKENDGFLATAPEVIVEEINVTGAEEQAHGVTVTRGLDTKNLKLKGKKDSTADGFFIESSKESYGWAHYVYHVGTGNYKSDVNESTYDDGSYHVTVISKDIVKNNNNSANYYDPETHEINSAEVDFTLDTTAPIVENVKYEEGNLFTGEPTKVTFTAIDNISLANITYTVGSESHTMEQGAKSEYSFKVPVSLFSDEQIAIVAKDKAGNYSDGTIEGNNSAAPNEALVQSGSVTIRASIWRYVPFIAGAILAVGVGAFVFVRSRKNIGGPKDSMAA